MYALLSVEKTNVANYLNEFPIKTNSKENWMVWFVKKESKNAKCKSNGKYEYRTMKFLKFRT